jgi:hypothetical protein
MCCGSAAPIVCGSTKWRATTSHGVATEPIQTCEICTKKEHRAADETPKPEAVDEKQVRSDEPKRERREHPEHLSGGGTRSTVRSTKALR